jgi:alpha-L-rhamnosidase
MDRIFLANWLMPSYKENETASEFFRAFSVEKEVKRATLWASALGVYVLRINGKKISYVLAPGWTAYHKRVQYQEYDVTTLLKAENTISMTAAMGWRMPYGFEGTKPVPTWKGAEIEGNEYAVIASLLIEYTDGTEELLTTDESWSVNETKWRACNIYHGDVYDENFVGDTYPVKIINHPKQILVPQEGEIISEHETFKPCEVIHTPKGEIVLDFGQNMTGYVSFTLTVPKGEKVVIDHAEILDYEGNFYNENYRSAKAQIVYIGDGEKHTWKPEFTFYGFRYIRLTEFPCELNPEDFTAIVVHSEMERTGDFECSDEKLNQLYHNIIWGQKGNFLDIPTDCPQRNERLGWTGDAQVFARCASYNYDTRKFYRKWLSDMTLEQLPDGRIPQIIPRLDWVSPACGWSDVCTILPWQMYLIYGDRDLLRRQYVTMKRWIDYMYEKGDEYINRHHFGDWLSQDAKDPTSCYGGTHIPFLALAFRAYSTSLFIKISQILDVCECDYKTYETKLIDTKKAIREQYFKDGMIDLATQTAHVLTLKFELCEEDKKQAHADRLAEMIHENGDRLTTGFLGTPYLLHVLEQYGYTDLAYTLLFQNKLPSWLYAVEHGATTMWEHWDGVREDGTFWDSGMNSYNHYAYGAVGDWLYGTVAGIETDENHPGFEHILFKPKTTEKLTYVKASLKTPYGVIRSEWHRDGEKTTYIFTVPSGLSATATIGNETHELSAGTHTFIQ